MLLLFYCVGEENIFSTLIIVGGATNNSKMLVATPTSAKRRREKEGSYLRLFLFCGWFQLCRNRFSGSAGTCCIARDRFPKRRTCRDRGKKKGVIYGSFYFVVGFNFVFAKYAFNCSKFIPLVSSSILLRMSRIIFTASKSFFFS